MEVTDSWYIFTAGLHSDFDILCGGGWKFIVAGDIYQVLQLYASSPRNTTIGSKGL